jgi:hypothetical protein
MTHIPAMSVNPLYSNLDSSDDISFDQAQLLNLLNTVTQAHVSVGDQYPFPQTHSMGGAADNDAPSSSGAAAEQPRSHAPHHPGDVDPINVPVGGGGLGGEGVEPRQVQPNSSSSQVTGRSNSENQSIDQDSIPRTSSDIPHVSQSHSPADVNPRIFPDRGCWNCSPHGYHLTLKNYHDMCEEAKHMNDVLQAEIKELEDANTALRVNFEEVLNNRDAQVEDLKDEVRELSEEAVRRQGVFDVRDGELARESRALSDQIDKLKEQVQQHQSSRNKIHQEHEAEYNSIAVKLSESQAQCEHLSQANVSYKEEIAAQSELRSRDHAQLRLYADRISQLEHQQSHIILLCLLALLPLDLPRRQRDALNLMIKMIPRQAHFP